MYEALPCLPKAMEPSYLLLALSYIASNYGFMVHSAYYLPLLCKHQGDGYAQGNYNNDTIISYTDKLIKVNVIQQGLEVIQ